MLRKHLDLPIALNISSATPPTSVTITNTAIDSSKNSSEMTEADTRYTSTDIFETEPCFLKNNSGNIAPSAFNEHFGAFCLQLKEEYNLPFSTYACIV